MIFALTLKHMKKTENLYSWYD